MRIAEVIQRKGADVVTISSQASVAQLIDLMSTRNIGAVVVSEDGRQVEGLVGERDVVRHLTSAGSEVLTLQVSQVMTTPVVTCTPEDDLDAVAHTMTYARLRHLPVVIDGQLTAIVSLGDVVKSHIDQLTDERNHLLHYIHA